MANETYLSDLINPEVMSTRLAYKIVDKIKFSPLAQIGFTLQGQAGNTVTLPYYNYIGDASVVGEFEAIGLSQLTASTIQATISKIGVAVEITDEAMLSALMSPLDESERQIALSLASKIDSDVLTVLTTISGDMISVGGTESSTNTLKDMIADGMSKFGEDMDEDIVVIVEPQVFTNIRKDPDFVYIANGQAKISGQVGTIYGANIVVTNKLKDSGTMYLVKSGAIGLEFKRGIEVETDRDILKKSTIISADVYYVAYLRDSSRAVEITYTLA